LCSQDPSSGPYPDPNQSSPRSTIAEDPQRKTSEQNINELRLHVLIFTNDPTMPSFCKRFTRKLMKIFLNKPRMTATYMHL
jgi:hypothetical protein